MKRQLERQDDKAPWLVRLNGRDRLILTNVLLPQKPDSWVEMAIAEDIEAKTRVTRAERQAWEEAKVIGIGLHGVPDFDEDLLEQTEVEISFDARERELLRNALKGRLEKRELPRKAAKLYRLFVLDPTKE